MSKSLRLKNFLVNKNDTAANPYYKYDKLAKTYHYKYDKLAKTYHDGDGTVYDMVNDLGEHREMIEKTKSIQGQADRLLKYSGQQNPKIMGFQKNLTNTTADNPAASVMQQNLSESADQCQKRKPSTSPAKSLKQPMTKRAVSKKEGLNPRHLHNKTIEIMNFSINDNSLSPKYNLSPGSCKKTREKGRAKTDRFSLVEPIQAFNVFRKTSNNFSLGYNQKQFGTITDKEKKGKRDIFRALFTTQNMILPKKKLCYLIDNKIDKSNIHKQNKKQFERGDDFEKYLNEKFQNDQNKVINISQYGYHNGSSDQEAIKALKRQFEKSKGPNMQFKIQDFETINDISPGGRGAEKSLLLQVLKRVRDKVER